MSGFAVAATSSERQLEDIAMQKITPFLWFDSEAEAAATFYVSIFDNSRILTTTRYGDAGPGPKGSAMTVVFELDGLRFTALNGGPQYEFTEAISFTVHCRTQEEVDRFWTRLTPSALGEMLSDSDPAKSKRVMNAMLKMKKIDIAALRRAYDQPAS